MRYGGATPSYLSYAGAQAINTDGYTFQDNDNEPVSIWGTNQAADGDGVPANNYDPVGDPKIIYVARPGFTATGSPTTIVDAVKVMSRYRQANPNQGLWKAAVGGEVVSTLSDMIFSTDSVYDALGALALTNNSTIPYPKPAFTWRYPDLRIVNGDTLDVDAYVSHMFARNGRPVAAIKFIVTDSSANSVEATVSQMTSVQHASGLYAPYFQASIDIASLDPGSCEIDAVVYPWCGPAYQASVDGDGARSIAFGVQTFYHDDDGSYQNAWAMVAKDGNDGAGQVYATEALCEAGYVSSAGNAYLTEAAAITAIQTAKGGSASGGVVLIQDGTYAKAHWPDNVAMDFPVTIKRSSTSTNRASVILQTSGTGGDAPQKIRFEDLTLEHNAAGVWIRAFATLSNIASDRTYIFDNVTGSVTGGTPGASTLYQIHRVYSYDCDGDDLRIQARFSADAKACIAIGCSNWVDSATYSAVACKSVQKPSSFLLGFWANSTQTDWPIGPQVHGHCFYGKSVDAQVIKGDGVQNDGYHLPCTIVERQIVGSSDAVRFNGDTNTDEMSNIGLICSTIVGQRLNFGYNDTGASPVAKDGFCRFVVTGGTWNSKDGTFASDPNGARWSRGNDNGRIQYRVGFRSNTALSGSSGNSGFYAPGNSWLGEVAALGDVNGSLTTPLDPEWTDDQSGGAGGAGDGDYTPNPVGTSVLSTIPAGLAPYPIDQRGRAIPNDGTGLAGALQAAV